MKKNINVSKEPLEVKGKSFIYRAYPLSNNRYIIIRGRNMDGQFVEYANMFAPSESKEARQFETRSDALKYLHELSRNE